MQVRQCSTSNAVLDLANSHALTDLKLSLFDDTTILLPNHQHHSLQCLCIGRDCTLCNLAASSALTELELTPASLDGVLWPASLPCLQQMKVHIPVLRFGERSAKLLASPSAWERYAALRHLDIPAYCAAELPSWISKLGQLEVVDMPDATLAAFPTCLLQLTRLQRLNFANMNASMSEDTVRLVNLPGLMFLSLGAKETNGSRLGDHNDLFVGRDVI